MKITLSENRVRQELKNGKMVYRWINYFDVWGNESDGYEINNLCYENIYIIGDNWNTQDIVKYLKKIGYLKKTSKNTKFHGYDSELYYGSIPVGRFEFLLPDYHDHEDIFNHILGKEYIANMYNPIGVFSIVAIA